MRKRTLNLSSIKYPQIFKEIALSICLTAAGLLAFITVIQVAYVAAHLWSQL